MVKAVRHDQIPVLAILYKAFVRSTLEYGNLEYFAAAPEYLQRLDRIQANAERLRNQKFTALAGRRKAAQLLD